MTPTHSLRALLLCAAALLLAGPALAQEREEIELKRISSDQRKLADQARRIETLLERLEAREHESGNEGRAKLLAGARERLSGTEGTEDLITLLESVAADLSDLRSGTALEAQTEVIRQLEDLLDYLLDRQRIEQMEALLEEAAERRAALDELVRLQADLLNQTGALQDSEQRSGDMDEGRRREAGEDQRDLNEKLRNFAEQDRQSRLGSPQTKEAAEAGEEAAELLDPNDGARQDAEAREGEEGSPAEAERQEGEAAEGEREAGGAEESGESEQSEQSEESSEGESPEGESPESESSEAERGERPSGESGEQNESGESGERPESESGQSGERQQGENPPQPGGETPPQEGGEQQPSSTPPSSGSPRSEMTPQSLQQAREAQERALDALEDAARQAREDEAELQEAERKEALLNVMNEATRLLERHLQVVRPLEQFVSESSTRRPSRRDRVQLRQWSTDEEGIAEDTTSLLQEVRGQGADSVPFLLSTLRDEHERLAWQLGSPNYAASEDQLALARHVTELWEELISTLEEEAQRDRVTMPSEQDGQQEGQEPEKQPLVSFAAEIQLLKRLEEQLRDRLDRLARRRRILQDAGLEISDMEREEMDRVVELQGQLRQIFESIMTRLEQAAEEPAEDET